jgi:hypothetical protein
VINFNTVGGFRVKTVIVLDESLSRGHLANVAAALAMSMAGLIPDPVGPDVSDADAKMHPGIVKRPIPVLGAAEGELQMLMTQSGGMAGVKVVSFTDIAQRSRTYDSYAEAMSMAGSGSIRYLGLGICGDMKSVAKLTGSLPLLK